MYTRPGGTKSIRIFMSIIGLAVLCSCDLGTGPARVFVDTPIDIEVVQGADPTDTVQASIPIRVALIPEDDEVPRPLRLQVAFSVPGEDCGAPSPPVTETGENDEAVGTWIFGEVAQECVLEVRALSPAGSILGLAQIQGVVLPGRGVDGWVPQGTVVKGQNQVVMDAGAYPLSDQFGNEVPWRLVVVDGPAVVLGTDVAEDASRTLVATDVGSGTVEVMTPFGAFLSAGFNVCTSGQDRWVRIFRPEDEGTALATCP